MYFDGVCNLCNATVDFLLRRPGLPEDVKFASLQSSEVTRLDPALAARAGFDTVVLIELGPGGSRRTFVESDAILRIVTSLGGAWRLAWLGYLIPRFARNAVYRFVARHRYRWFGRRATCRLPTPAEQARFLS